MNKKLKRKTKKIHVVDKKPIHKIPLPILLIGALFPLVLIISNVSSYHQYKPMLETEKTEVKKLPPEYKIKINHATPSATFRVPILIYHYVEYVADKKDAIRQSLNVNPDIFEQQLITLQKAGYTFITAKQFGDVMDGKEDLPQKPIILTFDDGHWDLYTDVLPLLQKYNIKATAYIIPGFLNGSDFLTITQLNAISASGLIEIGAHTVHHVYLKGKSQTVVYEEVKNSKSMLEVLLHKPIVSFAYPYGAFDQRSEDAVKKAGFATSVSTVPGIEDSMTNRYYLFRLRPGYRTGNDLLYYLENPQSP